MSLLSRPLCAPPSAPGSWPQARRRLWLAGEFLALFIALPLGLFFGPQRIPPMLLLWGMSAICAVSLLRDPHFDAASLWRPASLRREWKEMLALFAAGALVLAALTARYAPQLLFNLIRTKPLLWAGVMVLYPTLSVYPQGLIYRSFLMHRYAPLVGKRQGLLLLLSACAFALMHLVFRNYVAVTLTLPGGLLFAYRQEKSRSLFTSSVEHALFGCLIFTVGLGSFFYARMI